MSHSTDPGHFFQTTASLDDYNRKKVKAANKNGNPIQLRAKVLAILADPLNPRCVYAAESGGEIEKINIDTGEVSRFARISAAPVTCLSLSPDGKVLFAGSWDKNVYWVPTSQQKAKPRSAAGHSDFVKALLCWQFQNETILLSGSADSKIILWRLSPDLTTLEKIQTLQGHSRGILDLALDPFPVPEAPEAIRFLSAGSDREIRRWIITTPLSAKEDPTNHLILAHETSVFKLFYDSDGDLWTASADKTAKCLLREGEYKEVGVELQHPDFVKDIVVEDRGGWVVTACRDEEIRVWNRATGKLYHTFSGHFEEVTALTVLPQTQEVVSASIDSTIRTWSLQAQELAKAVEAAKVTEDASREDKAQGDSMLTAEEEAELAALMEED